MKVFGFIKFYAEYFREEHARKGELAHIDRPTRMVLSALDALAVLTSSDRTFVVSEWAHRLHGRVCDWRDPEGAWVHPDNRDLLNRINKCLESA